MSTATKTQYQLILTNGPTDDELASAWRYAFDPNHPGFTVSFAGYWSDESGPIKTTLPLTAQITGLLYESGIRGMLLIQANVTIGHGRSERMIGFYNTRDRSGYFKKGHFAWNEETD